MAVINAINIRRELGVRAFDVEVEFITEALGTRPKSPQVLERWLDMQREKAAKLANGDARLARIDEERRLAESEDGHDDVDERELARWTGWPTDPETGELFIYDYQIQGALRGFAQAYGALLGVRNARSKVERYVFVYPRQIRFGLFGADRQIERPLRAQTAQGQRVTVVRSDVIEAGTRIAFRVEIVPNPEITPEFVARLLCCGEFAGTFQWRTGGYGRWRVLRFDEVDPASPPPGLE